MRTVRIIPGFEYPVLINGKHMGQCSSSYWSWFLTQLSRNSKISVVKSSFDGDKLNIVVERKQEKVA